MHQPTYFGSATLGERGQIVIPADARKAMGLGAGDKLVVFGHGHGLVLMRAESVAEYVSRALGDLTALEARLREEFAENEGARDAQASTE